MSTNETYARGLIAAYQNGLETSPRGMKVRELIGYTMRFDPMDNVITLPGFETNLDYAKEELRWYYNGTPRIDFSPRIQRVWSRYSDDGVHVNSNYGNRMFSHRPENGKSQWQWVVDKLKEDPDSRQAVFNINSVHDKNAPTKDFPCTMSIQAMIRNKDLYWVTHMRSNDAVMGLRNDLYCFTEMQKRMATELGTGLGSYTHIAGSWHLYEKDWSKVEKLIVGGLERRV